MHEIQVGLTSDRYWHIKEQSIPGINEEDFGNIPLFSPDMLYFPVEEDEPVIYLAIG